ncbi:putative C2 domain protein [Novymonas esmeraldas]|uniref:C2 domain protein n=1 Tax=Novymonas esmeraldas TaxID=1808958 RepID=A0AAW0F1P2_9TRYP
MGKLTVKVHNCELYRPVVSGNCAVNPRVTVVVDGTYRFQTHVKKNTVRPEYNDSFFVGNTHRLAVVEVSVYDVQEPSGLVLPGIGVFTATRGVVRAPTCIGVDEDDVATSSGAAGAGSGVAASASSSSKAPTPVLLGRCYISIERLVHNERRRRKYYLATPLPSTSATATAGSEISASMVNAAVNVGAAGASPATVAANVGPSLLLQSLPQGISGTVTISLESDSLGESAVDLRLNEQLEAAHVRRLRRFLLCYDRPKVAMLDVMMAHVRDVTELGPHINGGPRRNNSNTASSQAASRTGRVSRAGATPATSGAVTPRRYDADNCPSPALLSVRDGDADGGEDGDPVPGSSRPNRVLVLDPHASPTSSTIVPLFAMTQRKRSVCLGGRAELTAKVPDERETFEAMMNRLCEEYHVSEPGDFRLVMRVDGCTNINKDDWNQSLLGSDDVFVVVRSEAEEFSTSMATLQGTVVWAEANTITMDVVNPSRFCVTVILMGRSGTRTYEIGRCYVSAAPLSLGHVSRRNMFLCMGTSVTRVAANGVVHLLVRPINFGLTPADMAESVDGFYDRLSRFFKRYDPLRLPEVDVVARARLRELDTYMKDLVVEYGREPGTVRMRVVVDSLVSLRETAEMDLSGQNIRVLVTMGSSSVRTKAFAVRQFAPTKVRENYMFDVVRETDLICIEVVNARKENVVYGRVDFSCLNTQRGVMNRREFHLVGAAGTPEAYFSGIVRVGLYSDEVGHKYQVDMDMENAFAGRLRRYVYRRVPESLHRVNLAVATVFDMESFMAQLAVDYGDEDPTYALYFTVVGCRQLRSGFAGINPYVVVRVGIDAYQTKTAKASEEPDYFEFFQFHYDRPGDMAITLVVMDQSDIGNDEELGRAVIPLADVQPSRQYNDWLPLVSEKRSGKVREVGTIGFKYVVTDLNLVDRTRARLVKEQYRERTDRVPSTVDGAREGRGRSVGSPGTAGGTGDTASANGTSGAGHHWAAFKRYFQQTPLTAYSTRAVGGTASPDDDSDHLERSVDESTAHVVTALDTSSFKSGRSIASRTPTLNLMDGGIGSVEEFCSVDASQLNSTIPSDTDGDLSVSLDMADTMQHRGTETLARACIPVDEGDAGTRMQLRVRLLSCTNLFKPGRNMPNPYVLLSTICESHRSRVQFCTTEPRFNETFRFTVEDPNIDYLSITVLTDTPYGSKKLGHCTLSMRNVQRGTMRTRWTSLVIHPFQPAAVECGSVYLSLGAVNFGMNYLPSIDAENRLREQIREHLSQHARRQLHRLEWYVGEFSQLESILLGGWFRDHGVGVGASADDTGTRAAVEGGVAALAEAIADLEVTVLGVSHLYTAGFLAEGSCVVKARVNGTTRAKTRSIAGTQGSFVVQQGQDPLRFTVAEPTTTLVRLCVVLNGKTSAGDCYLSLADLHRGVAKERTLMVVMDSRSSHATPVGLIRVSVLCSNYGSSAPAPTEEELALHSRLTRFFYYYIPNELAMVDVKYATTLNVEAYLSRMVDKYGPEPGDHHLRFTLDRCRNLVHKSDNTTLHVFCIVRAGLQEFHSSIVEGRGECVFCETFDLAVGLPLREKVELILMRYYPSKRVELGRTQLELRTLRRAEENTMELALVSNVGTKSAGVSGLLKVLAYPTNFGRDGQMHARSHSTFAYGLGGQSLMAQTTYLFAAPTPTPAGVSAGPRSTAASIYGAGDDPSDGERTTPPRSTSRLVTSGSRNASFAWRSGGGGAAATSANASRAGGTSATITIVGFVGLTMRDAEIYLRVSDQDKVLLKTRPIPVDQLVALEANAASFTIENVSANYDKAYTLKLGFRKLFGAEALCYADFCITRCPAGKTVEKRLRLYDVNSQFLGMCRLSVTMPDVHLRVKQWQHLSPNVFEPLMDDVASLVSTYMPKDVRRLDLILCHAPDIRRVHRALRLQLAPSVAATVYVAIHDLDLHSTTMRHTCVVHASVGDFSTEAARRQPGAAPVYPHGMSKEGISKMDFPLLRVDISATGPAATLTLSVCDRASKSRSEEIGRTVVSLRALLTPAAFDMSERVQVPLVSVRHAVNRVHATLVGTVTFSIMPPAFESYGASVRFASNVVEGFDRAYVRYYADRICRLLRHYDANSLVDIHARLYETYVSCRGWESGLPSCLSDLVLRWGPEIDSCTPPPPLRRRDDAQHSTAVAQQEHQHNSPSPRELTPADETRPAR